MPPRLPDFDAPPVVETALGVEFAPLQGWSIPHFGLFWSEIRGDYPKYAVQPPLGSQIERFGEEERPTAPKLEVVQLPAPELRCWFVEKSESRILQVQRDRFIHNWRKPGPSAAYPHYENIRPIFEREWNRFCDFVGRESLGTPEVVQCEVSYVNHLERGKGWDSFGDIDKVVRSWSEPREGVLARPEGMVLNARYSMPGNQGRLHVQLQPVFRPADAKEALQLTLTARGRPASSRTEDVLQWVDLGREWVVCGFTEFTSDDMHRIWRRKEDRR